MNKFLDLMVKFSYILCFIGWHVDRPLDTALNGAIVYTWECLECGRTRENQR